VSEKDTIRDAIVYRIKNGPRVDNLGFGFALVTLFGVVPVTVIIAICTTIYYCLKLFAR
jgi:hypothetical protein